MSCFCIATAGRSQAISSDRSNRRSFSEWIVNLHVVFDSECRSCLREPVALSSVDEIPCAVGPHDRTHPTQHGEVARHLAVIDRDCPDTVGTRRCVCQCEATAHAETRSHQAARRRHQVASKAIAWLLDTSGSRTRTAQTRFHSLRQFKSADFLSISPISQERISLRQRRVFIDGCGGLPHIHQSVWRWATFRATFA